MIFASLAHHDILANHDTQPANWFCAVRVILTTNSQSFPYTAFTDSSSEWQQTVFSVRYEMKFYVDEPSQQLPDSTSTHLNTVFASKFDDVKQQSLNLAS
jgi:hypothetical protein